MKGVAHSDGGNRATLGACAAVLAKEDGTVVEKHLLFPREGLSNNFCEYQGVKLALRTALSEDVDDLTIYSDSQLIVNQLSGLYRVRKTDLKPLFDEVVSLASELSSVSIHHVYREFNKYPDALCNYYMDQAMGRPNTGFRLRTVRKHPPSGVKLPRYKYL